MADWRKGSADAGFEHPETLLATGNMVVGSDLGQRGVKRAMTDVIRRLGLRENVVVFARRPSALRRILEANPFPRAGAERPGEVAVYFFAKPRPDFSWVADYQGDEEIAVVGEHLVVDHHTQTGSRLPVVIEKRCGPATARNWSTVTRLHARANARQEAN